MENAAEIYREIGQQGASPAFTGRIASIPCDEELRAGLYFINGDWHAAHQASQSVDTQSGCHWHALVHRHEPDYPNSKYWLRRVGQSPLYPELARYADKLGQAALVTENGAWDPFAFTDCFADPAHREWARQLDQLETNLLMQYCLDTENK